MHVVLLHNEKAEDEAWTGKELLKLVRNAGLNADYCDIDEVLARPRILNEVDFVIAAGGDGTAAAGPTKRPARSLSA